MDSFCLKICNKNILKMEMIYMTHRGVLKSPDVFTCKGYHILHKHHMLKHMVKRHTIVNLKSHCHELSF